MLFGLLKKYFKKHLTNRQKSGIIVYENKADTLCLTV